VLGATGEQEKIVAKYPGDQNYSDFKVEAAGSHRAFVLETANRLTPLGLGDLFGLQRRVGPTSSSVLGVGP
jgi:hypothetical protein